MSDSVLGLFPLEAELASAPSRSLIVTADDFGIGVATSQGILDLAREGVLTATVLLVNSPLARVCVDLWHAEGQPIELGWHPCLTLDAPVSAASQVPSLVDRHGRFWSLGQFLRRLACGQIRSQEVETELRAQLARFIAWVGHPPEVVNAHHHLHIFPLVGRVLRKVLNELPRRPYLRRVVEPWRQWWALPGNRGKRAFMSWWGHGQARWQKLEEFPGNEALIGISDPADVPADDFFAVALDRAEGRIVELVCHPGYLDAELLGRDGSWTDGKLHRRGRELELLSRPAFLRAVDAAGFTLVRPRAWPSRRTDAEGRLLRHSA